MSEEDNQEEENRRRWRETYGDMIPERIVDTKIGEDGKRYYKVQWAASSFEPAKNFLEAELLIRKYWDPVEKKLKIPKKNKEERNNEFDDDEQPGCSSSTVIDDDKIDEKIKSNDSQDKLQFKSLEDENILTSSSKANIEDTNEWLAGDVEENESSSRDVVGNIESSSISDLENKEHDKNVEDLKETSLNNDKTETPKNPESVLGKHKLDENIEGTNKKFKNE